VRRPLVLVRGGGDLASGVAARLFRSGFGVVVVEAARPLAVRRLVSFAEAVYVGQVEIEGIRGRLAADPAAAVDIWREGVVPVLVDAAAECRFHLRPVALIDGRMLKGAAENQIAYAPLVVGLGPGFTAGRDCHALVETNRGHHMGRVFWEGSAQPDTGVPELVAGYGVERVLRAPASGVIHSHAVLGTLIGRGQLIAEVGGAALRAPFAGALRGLMHDGSAVQEGTKIGDLDPRGLTEYCFQISDKSLAVGGGVLEALLSRAMIRRALGA
jgi:xanthine dehydrogenase accessory factor